MNEVVVKEKAPLDELMLAMDVVDTLRHKELVLARELSAEDRDAQLVEHLRQIYTSQGIVVTDEILQRARDVGIRQRARWGKLAGAGVAALAVAAIAFQLFVRGPALREATEVPAELTAAYQAVDALSDDPAALDAARAQLTTGEAAIAQGDYDAARAAIDELQTLNFRLNLEYELRVVSRPGEQSGVWREPEVNRAARNYYLIVEAVAPDGDALRVPVTSEEDGRTRTVSAWGLRVDEATYNRVAADKRDDGIIQDGVVGRKRRGVLEREYTVPTTGAAITEW